MSTRAERRREDRRQGRGRNSLHLFAKGKPWEKRGKLIGYVNNHGQVFTPNGSLSTPGVGRKENKAHSARIAAAQELLAGIEAALAYKNAELLQELEDDNPEQG